MLLAPLVQLVEHRSPKPSAEGSSPSGRATLCLFNTRNLYIYIKKF